MTNNQKTALAEKLFNMVALQLLRRLEEGEYTHQDMKNAIEFLKNNNITSDLNNPEVIQGLLKDIDLPFPTLNTKETN